MIFASQTDIDHYTARGDWGTETFLDRFRSNAAEKPDVIALIDPPNKMDLVGYPEERITYSELVTRVDALATALIEQHQVGKDDIIVVQLPNTMELIITYMAITRVGAVFAPMPVQWRNSELEYIAGLTEAKIMITVEKFGRFNHVAMAQKCQANLPALTKIITLDKIREMTQGAANTDLLDQIPIDANDTYTLCWSSGTESHPKGCPMSHNNWFVQGQIMHNAVIGESHDQETILCCAPIVNMTGVGIGLILWLLSGGTLLMHHPLDVEMCIKQVSDEKATRTIFVPTVLNMILKHPNSDQFDLSSLRRVMTGSAPPSVWALKEFKRRWDIDISCGWGQTEGTALMVGVDDIEDMEKRARFYPNYGDKSRDWLIKNVDTKIVDNNTGETLTEIGQVGQLAYKGPNVFPGYFKREDINAESFDDEGYFYTGDLFKIEDGGYISFFDRCKDIIIRGGNNISAQEIENLLQGHEKVLDVAAVGMPDEVLGERTCVYVVPKDPDNMPELKELTDFMKEIGTAVYKLPERVERAEAIPRNPVGKILKPQLRKEITATLAAEKA
ncbi:MAG: acyl--CoA ligase [Pseudomonadales bacterium]|nr:acyl--CoA ligase [Pseudomonadales bacterium]